MLSCNQEAVPLTGDRDTGRTHRQLEECYRLASSGTDVAFIGVELSHPIRIFRKICGDEVRFSDTPRHVATLPNGANVHFLQPKVWPGWFDGREIKTVVDHYVEEAELLSNEASRVIQRRNERFDMMNKCLP